MTSFAVLHTLPARGFEGLAQSRGYSLELIDENGAALPTFISGRRTYVLGALGKRYSLRLRNTTGQRVEMVASVDGRDVLDGRPSDWGKRGYIVNPYDQVTIDGFRLNNDSVAAFRFSSVGRSYAARMGDARDVGVIGVAVFPERLQPRVYAPPPMPMERLENDAASGEAQAQSAPAAPSLGSATLGTGAKQKSAELRRGLGTEFGEQRESQVFETEFARASATPAALLSLRYDDCAGLIAMGVSGSRGYCPVQDDVAQRQSAEPFRRNPNFCPPPPGWTGR
jgi:hypothetical protein